MEADYFVLLNSDVEVTPNWVEPIIDMMEADKNIAICQPKLLSYYQRDTFEYAGGAGGYIDKYGYPFCRGRLFTTLEKDNSQYNDACEIFWATGAAMFVKANVWKRLGGLDGDFFAHMEEIDFCWRAKNAGYKVCYCPQSVASAYSLRHTLPPECLQTVSGSMEFWKYGILIGILGCAIPSFFFAIGTPKISAGAATILSSSELPAGIICSVLILAEAVTPLQWAGVVLLFFGIAYPYLAEWVLKKTERRKISG